MKNFAISIVKNEHDFMLLRDEWEGLLAKSPNKHFFYDFIWKWRSWTCVAAPAGQNLRIVTGRLNSELVLVFPLIVKDRVARFLNSATWEYRDLLLDEKIFDDAWVQATWDAVLGLGEFDVLLLQNVRSPSHLARFVAASQLKPLVAHDESPVIRLGTYAGWDQFANGRPKKLIADQRRQWRRLRSAVPDLQCKVMVDIDEVLRTLHWMIEQKDRWANRKKISQMAWDGNLKEFIVQAACDAFDAERLLAIKLCKGKDILSAGFGFVFNRQFTFEFFAYDYAWENYSPSRLLQETIIRWCIDNEIAEFDFLPGGGGTYKQSWADHYVRSTTYAIATTTKGQLTLSYHKHFLPLMHRQRWPKSLYSKLPAPIRGSVRKLFSTELPTKTIEEATEED